MRKLVVFARWPRSGAVKSRLSPALPADLARGLYEDMLRDVLEAGRAAAVEERWLAWADAPEDPSFEGAEGYRQAPQRGADLGERLEHATRERLEVPQDRVVVIGADAPELTGARIGQAFDALEERDAVLGPTRDGGYYLLGLSRPAPEILRGIPWGADRVLALTLERARERGLDVATLEPLEDIDTPEDLVRLVVRCYENPRGCPRTAAGLRRLGLLGLLPEASA